MFLRMLKVALNDEVISDDELAMLQKVDEHYGHYNTEFKKAVTDGFISEDECRKLRELRNKIYEDVLRQALRDGVISDDERAILDEIKAATEMSDEEIGQIEERVRKGKPIIESKEEGCR
ncbi:MAG: hypothetical protein ACE5PM_05480 [Candidatus Hydrothermarchaeales archaeon]